MIGFNLTREQTIWLNKKQSETHKTTTELMRQIMDTYIQFEKAGYLDPNGNKIAQLETELQLKEKLRVVQAGILQDKISAQKELDKLKEEESKRKAQDRAVRNQPKVDYGNVIAGSGDGFMLGDE